jgi:hypothetical protein
MALEKEASAMHLIEKLAEYKVGAIALTKIEKLAARIGIDETKLLELYVKAKNAVSKSTFAKTPFDKRLLFLPQCLRSRNCPASLSDTGYICQKCGRCGLHGVISKALELGYKGAFILSGGSMVGQILKREKPLACLGIACAKELLLGGFVCEKFGAISHFIPLSRDGCVETQVNWNEVDQTLALGPRSLQR